MKICIVCGNTNKRNAKLYCSYKCTIEHNHQKWIERWKAGKENGIRGGVCTSRHIRKYLMRKQHNKCLQCGWGETNVHTNTVPLHLDHIDGNYKNNKPSNVRLICPNCHSLTSTYGSLNRGKGRPFYVIKRECKLNRTKLMDSKSILLGS